MTKQKVMAFQLDAKFFRRAKKVNRAVEITDTQAFIPAVKDSPEIRVPLPNRRLKTADERKEELDAKAEQIQELEEEIEKERKVLLEKTTEYRSSRTGAAEVVVQNLKVKDLMNRRNLLAYPDVWIEEIKGLTLKDVFESKRDVRKIGSNVFQIKRRLENLQNVYLDLGAKADASEARGEDESLFSMMAPSATATAMASPVPVPVPNTAQRGAIVQQTKKVFKLKKATGAATAPATAAPATAAPKVSFA